MQAWLAAHLRFRLHFVPTSSLWLNMVDGQVELLDRNRWNTRLELANAIFEYLEIFHNRQRRHSSLSMLTPVEFEARHQPTTAT